MISIDQQIAEVSRELAQRRKDYPVHVSRGRMRQPEAEHCMACLEAALETLKFCRDNADAIRAAYRRGASS